MTNEGIARKILAATSYTVLSAADADGVPWASPVWFAMEEYAELFWVSYPGARHSQNIAMRPRIAMVVFDSTVPPGTGQGVYMSATAEQLTHPSAVERGIGVFSRRSVLEGAGAMRADEVSGQARLRLIEDATTPCQGRAGSHRKRDTRCTAMATSAASTTPPTVPAGTPPRPRWARTARSL